MKTVALALSALVALSGAALAAGPNARNEKPDTVPVATSIEKVDVKAGSIYSTRHLERAGLSADSIVSVTKIPSSGIVGER
ncbi:MAG: hypothetical protein QM656_17015 [Paracoccaceae bacterium]